MSIVRNYISPPPTVLEAIRHSLFVELSQLFERMHKVVGVLSGIVHVDGGYDHFAVFCQSLNAPPELFFSQLVLELVHQLNLWIAQVFFSLLLFSLSFGTALSVLVCL